MKTFIRFTLSVLLTLIAVTTQAGDKITYYHNDALGSPVAATNQLGQVIWRETYKPYGERTTKATASANNTVWFTGKPEESALGINYFGARWYHPEVGRFLVFDPAGVTSKNIHSFNRYGYANNNPYKYVDPDGRNPLLAAEGGWAIGVGLDALVYHATGVALTTFLADAAWNALHNEAENAPSSPTPNNGEAKPHGGEAHDGAINDRVEDLKKDPSVENIRKNQQQVDVNGNKVGANRPDVQFDKDGCHHCVEYDTKRSNGERHGEQIRQNDPKSKVELNGV